MLLSLHIQCMLLTYKYSLQHTVGVVTGWYSIASSGSSLYSIARKGWAWKLSCSGRAARRKSQLENPFEKAENANATDCPTIWSEEIICNRIQSFRASAFSRSRFSFWCRSCLCWLRSKLRSSCFCCIHTLVSTSFTLISWRVRPFVAVCWSSVEICCAYGLSRAKPLHWTGHASFLIRFM